MARLRTLAISALAAYDVEPLSITVLGHLFNTTFDVKAADGSRYVLRIHRLSDDGAHTSATRARIESELWWLEHLRRGLGLDVPAALRTAAGESVLTIDAAGVPAPRLCVLFRRMDGRFLHHRLTPAHLEQVGRLTARLHDDSSRLSVPGGFSRPRVDDTDGAAAERRVHLFREAWSAKAADLVTAVQARIRAAQEGLGRWPHTFGLIHANIHQENYLFAPGGVRLIDFDDCGWGYYLYDLAVTIHNIDVLPHGPALRQALLRGYEEIRGLPPRHDAIIDTFYALRELQMLTWFLEERDNPSFQDRAAHVKNGLAMLGRFLQDERCERGAASWWKSP